jgi:chromatin remodeling complex protein RSC6
MCTSFLSGSSGSLYFHNIRLDKGNGGKKRGGGFTKLCSLSPALQEFVGASELARTEVTLLT